jgi:hypothetical protein
MILARVRRPDCGAASIDSLPSITPKHRDGELPEEAIAYDAASLASDDLLGLATDESHWRPAGDVLIFNPPPPDSLPLVFDPNAELEVEMDRAVAAGLRGRRITIVGGVYRAKTVSDLCKRYSLAETSVRWLPSEPGSHITLDALDGLSADRDVVYCVTGHISHAESISAKKRCRKRGIKAHAVEDSPEIIDHLRSVVRDK